MHHAIMVEKNSIDCAFIPMHHAIMVEKNLKISKDPLDSLELLDSGCLESVEWNGGMERWNQKFDVKSDFKALLFM